MEFRVFSLGEDLRRSAHLTRRYNILYVPDAYPRFPEALFPHDYQSEHCPTVAEYYQYAVPWSAALWCALGGDDQVVCLIERAIDLLALEATVDEVDLFLYIPVELSPLTYAIRLRFTTDTIDADMRLIGQARPADWQVLAGIERDGAELAAALLEATTKP